jgi:hypothetical protein
MMSTKIVIKNGETVIKCGKRPETTDKPKSLKNIGYCDNRKSSETSSIQTLSPPTHAHKPMMSWAFLFSSSLRSYFAPSFVWLQ